MASPHQAFESALPQNTEAEKCVLGSILLHNPHYNVVAEVIHAEDFLLETHQRIFRLVGEMLDQSQAVDLVTLTAELRKHQLLDRVGGAVYVSSLVDGIPRIMNVRHYADLVKEKAQLRTLMETSARLREAVLRGDRSPQEVVEEAMSSLFQVAEGRLTTGFISMRDILHGRFATAEAVTEHVQQSTGIRTDFVDLDDDLMGLHPANLIIVGARPSVGKTSFCLNICENVAIRQGKKVGIFSLEMSREELALRLLCSEARVNLRNLRRQVMRHDDSAKLSMAFGALLDAPIYIDDDAGVTVTEIRAKSRRLKMEHGLDLIIIDYLQLVSAGGRYENKNQEISAITRSLKGLSKELDLPVICVSQLSRAPEGRADKRPLLSDLRESGAIEQDADVVCLLFRELKEETGGVAELIIAKNRNGPAGKTITLAFAAEFTKFLNYDYTHSKDFF